MRAETRSNGKLRNAIGAAEMSGAGASSEMIVSGSWRGSWSAATATEKYDDGNLSRELSYLP